MTADKRLHKARRAHMLQRLDLIGLAHCAECFCPRSSHEHPEAHNPGHCQECVACKRYRPRSLW